MPAPLRSSPLSSFFFFLLFFFFLQHHLHLPLLSLLPSSTSSHFTFLLLYFHTGPNGKKIEDVAVEDFDRVYSVNLRGSFNVTKHAIVHMKKQNYGRILLIASIAGKEGNAVRCA